MGQGITLSRLGKGFETALCNAGRLKLVVVTMEPKEPGSRGHGFFSWVQPVYPQIPPPSCTELQLANEGFTEISQSTEELGVMASTPSTSALSAVLRCKRPPASAYRLGLTCGAVSSVSRAEQSDEPERRSSLRGSISPKALVGFPGVASVSVRLESAEHRGQKGQKSLLYQGNYPAGKDSGLHKAAGCVSSGRNVAHESRVTLNCALRNIGACGLLTDSLSVKLSSLSEPGRVLCVGCRTHLSVSSHHHHHLLSFFMLKTTLLQLTAFVLAKLGAVWNKSPVAI
ncbi:hypothetical protein NFI96_000404 [Prochilodus magdalenae]|nr:hypothetical protein NFI96_000404 [Prochilodus magdalenae]